MIHPRTHMPQSLGGGIAATKRVLLVVWSDRRAGLTVAAALSVGRE